MEPSVTIKGGQAATRTECPAFLQLGNNLPGNAGIDLGDRFRDTALELSDDLEINQGAGDVELQAQLLAHFGDELEDGVLELRAISAGLLRLLDGPRELRVDDLLGALQAGVGVELLIDDRIRLLHRHDPRGQAGLPLEALGDGRFADAEVASSVGLAPETSQASVCNPFAAGPVSPGVGRLPQRPEETGTCCEEMSWR